MGTFRVPTQPDPVHSPSQYQELESRLKKLEDFAFSFQAMYSHLTRDGGYRNLDIGTRNWVDLTYSEFCRAMKPG